MLIIQITVDSKSRGRRKPVCFLSVLGQILISKFQKIVQKAAGKDVKNPDLSGVKRVEEEEELPDGRADVEGVEGLVETVELRQSLDQLRNVVLDVLFTKKSIPRK
jgi:hypothetical protein